MVATFQNNAGQDISPWWIIVLSSALVHEIPHIHFPMEILILPAFQPQQRPVVLFIYISI